MKTREDSYLYSQTTNIIKELTVNQGLHDHILKDVQLNNTPLENIIYIGCKDDYKKNYDKMIQGGGIRQRDHSPLIDIIDPPKYITAIITT